MMFVPWDQREAHKAALQKGLSALGPGYLASLCFWCEGMTERKFEDCQVCGPYGYGTACGLLVGGEPAPQSVVNQVLIAGAAL